MPRTKKIVTLVQIEGTDLFIELDTTDPKALRELGLHHMMGHREGYRPRKKKPKKK